jgi:hypothetical protein
MARFAGVMDEFDPRPNKTSVSPGLSLSAAEQDKFISALSGPIYHLSYAEILNRLRAAKEGTHLGTLEILL